MRKKCRRILALLTAGIILVSGLAGCGAKKESADSKAERPGTSASAVKVVEETEFVPELDTEASVELLVSGSFGNFEALDQVINHFNEYYPNVYIAYEQSSGNGKLKEYLNNNRNVDIFMTNDTNLRYPNWEDYYVGDWCVDLNTIGIHSNVIQDAVIKACTFDGELLRIPLGLIINGIVVNKTLLEKEGLELPTNYSEFLTVCEALKNKGYTPIQGPEKVIYGGLTYNLAMTTLGGDPALLDALNKGGQSAVDAMTEIYGRVEELKSKGYIDSAVNAEYPDDNYDGAILKFLEGDVPFWVCDTEKFSGMRKRESKSENFKAEPFEYEFIYPPMGDTGACAFVESWIGFSLNRNSSHLAYAEEFFRFMVQSSELNTLASVKGVPSVCKVSVDKRYAAIRNTEGLQAYFFNDGTILNHVKDYFLADARQLGVGKEGYTSARDAAASYVARCYETAQEVKAGN